MTLAELDAAILIRERWLVDIAERYSLLWCDDDVFRYLALKSELVDMRRTRADLMEQISEDAE